VPLLMLSYAGVCFCVEFQSKSLVIVLSSKFGSKTTRYVTTCRQCSTEKQSPAEARLVLAE